MLPSLTYGFFRDRAELCTQLASSSEMEAIKTRLLALADDYRLKAQGMKTLELSAEPQAQH